MIRKNWGRFFGVAAVLLSELLLSSTASAGVIGGYNGAVGGGYATVNGQSYGPINTYYPNDAEQGGAGGPSQNVLDVSKTFTQLTPIDMSFHVNDSGGFTSYLFDEDVTNNTGVNWTDFHFELGFGTGNNFVQSSALLVFDPTNPAGSDSFLNGVQGDYTVDWTNGGIANGATGIFEVQIIVPDTALALPPGYVLGQNQYDFTLRQYPTVPEASSIALVGCAIAVLGFAARRRRSI